MIKVCHMTSAHKSTDTRIFHKQCVSLAKSGYDVCLVTLGESYESNGVKIIGVPKVIGGRLIRMTQGTKSIYKKALEINADIYHIHDPELLPYALKLKKKKKKVIFDSHEYYYLLISHKYYLPSFMRKLAANIYDIYETRVCKKIDAVVFPCLVNGKDVFANRSNKSIFIDNTPILNELYNKYDVHHAKINRAIVYIGDLTYERGITQLVKASFIAEATLVLCGVYNPQSYFDELKDLKEYECVDYKGFVNRHDVCKILNECLVGICTILCVGQYKQVDNLATKVYEYMSMGLPVIISNGSYARKVNEKYECFILVNPEDVDEIACAINYLLEHTEIAKKMGQNGRRAILEEFNWGIEEKKLLELYGEIKSI